MSTPLSVCVIAWSVITAIYVVLTIYRSLIGMHEDDQLFLNPAETSMEVEQRQVQTKLARVTPFTKGFGFASLGLLLVSAGVWFYDLLKGSGMMP